jgi:hypothetical protein
MESKGGTQGQEQSSGTGGSQSGAKPPPPPADPDLGVPFKKAGGGGRETRVGTKDK